MAKEPEEGGIAIPMEGELSVTHLLSPRREAPEEKDDIFHLMMYEQMLQEAEDWM